MKIRLRMFAILRERTGTGSADLELPTDATVEDAVREVGQLFSEIAPLLPRTMTAVNLSYCDRKTVLKEGDELAIIPPVSGG